VAVGRDRHQQPVPEIARAVKGNPVYQARYSKPREPSDPPGAADSNDAATRVILLPFVSSPQPLTPSAAATATGMAPSR
jgi:hypothetical protein